MRISDWSSDVCSSDLGRCLGASVRTGERHLNRAVDIAATEPQVVATGEIVEPLVGDGEALQRCVPAQRQGLESACKGAFHRGGPGGLDAKRVSSNLGIGQAQALSDVAQFTGGEVAGSNEPIGEGAWR